MWRAESVESVSMKSSTASAKKKGAAASAPEHVVQRPKRLIRTRTFIARIIATFVASGLSIVGIGSAFGLDLFKSVLFAGAVGVATVTEGLARAYLTDGKLTLTEMNRAFRNYDSKLQTQEEGYGYGSCHCTNCCPNV